MIDLTFVTRFGLILIRPGILVAAAPPFGGLYTPMPVKIGLSVVLGLAVSTGVPLPEPTTAAALVLLAAREVAIGLALAMSVRVLMAGAELAGQLAGFQLGFAYAAVVDPQTGARNNIVAALYSSLTLLTFLGINGHHALLQALAASYQAMPIGFGHLDAGVFRHVAALLGVVFTFGTQLAAPVVVVLLVAEVGIGLVSRAAPAINLMVIGFPVRLLAGMVALAAAISAVPGLVHRYVMPALELAGRLAFGFR